MGTAKRIKLKNITIVTKTIERYRNNAAPGGLLCAVFIK